MSAATTIAWTDATWNPVRGCSRVSEGCRHCYAERVAARFSGAGQPYEGLATMTPDGPRWTGTVRLVPEQLAAPLHWVKPRRVFVNSMSDLFHEGLPPDHIYTVFHVMRQCPQHQFQVLTKRPERMCYLLQRWQRDGLDHAHGEAVGAPNIWLGVSVEDQATADARIPLLLATPAAVRFVSVEPLLGPVDLRPYLSRDALFAPIGGDALPGLTWVIVGGESGPGARPCRVEWIQAVVDQCRAAGVPVFVKQLGRCPVVDYYAGDDETLQDWACFFSQCRRAHFRGGRLLPAPEGLQPDHDAVWMPHLADAKGADPFEWPEHLQVREFPT